MTDNNSSFSFFSSSSSSAKSEKQKKERNPTVMAYAENYAKKIRVAVSGNELAAYLVAALIALKGKNSRFEVKDKKLLENAIYFARWGRSNDSDKPIGLSESELDATVQMAIKTVAQGVRWGSVPLPAKAAKPAKSTKAVKPVEVEPVEIDDDDDEQEQEQEQEQDITASVPKPADIANALSALSPDALSSFYSAIVNSMPK